MAFRLEMAVVTLRQTLDALAAARATLDKETHQILEDLIRHYGPQIAEESGPNVAPVARSFLEELWVLRTGLPVSVIETMRRAQGQSEALLVPVDEASRRALVVSMITVADVRHYADAPRLASDVTRLVSANQHRLIPTELEQWRRIRAELQRAGDAEAYLRGMEALLGHYARVHDTLSSHKTWRVYRSGGFVANTEPHTARPMPGGTEGPRQVRYGNAYFPATVLLSQKMVPLVVHVTRMPAAASSVPEEEGRVAVEAGDLTLVLHAEGFRLADSVGGAPIPGVSAARKIAVHPERDCEPVIFFLAPESAGVKHVCVDLYQTNRNVGSLAFDTTVVEDESRIKVGNVALNPLPVVSAAPEAKPPDLELRVSLSADRSTLSFVLHAPVTGDYNFQPAGQQKLQVDPKEYLQRDLDRLSALGRVAAESRSPEETRRSVQELASIGVKLYTTLIPAELKAEYRRLRTAYAGKTLLITSDEPWIPWEMVKPFEADANGNVLYDDPHLCEMFQVARWLAGRGPRHRIWLANGVIVLPPDNLQAAREEAEYFSGLHHQQWVMNIADPPLTTVAAVQESFRAGQTQLYHFACHGNFDNQDPDESKLKLADGFLRASQIGGDAQAGLRRANPLVFLNACHTGEVGFTLTRLGGWAQRFLESGASAFIGSMWEINDELAARFAIEVYNRLWGLGGYESCSLGEAVQRARLAIKQLDPANPTWLAYVLYGDPEGRVVLRDGRSQV